MENIYGFDCETTALDPLSGKLALIQINNGSGIELYEPLRDETALSRARAVLENEGDVIVGHNLKFDLKWACTNGIMLPPGKVFDTMIASQLIYAGITTADEATLRSGKISKAYDRELEPIFDFTTDAVQFDVAKGGRFSHSLQAVLLRELGVVIKKEMQTSDWSKPLTLEQREYAQSDVRHLPKLYRVLKRKLEEWGLTRVAEIEMQLVYVLAYLEMVGAKIDRAQWQAYAAELRAERDDLKADLEYDLGMKSGGNVGLFGMVPDPVNADSNPQMLKVFPHLPNMQNETIKKALEEPDCDPLLRKYAKYKAVAKLASTYGDKYLSFAHYRDRLRGEFTQASTATGRLSSRSPNQQNVPPKIIKSNLRAEEGYEVYQADYSQVELKILASLSQDANFLKTTQESDVHEANARLINNIPEGEPVPKEARRKAKVLSFSIPYGVSAVGLWQRDLAPTVAEAKALLDQFYTTFPGVKKYLEAQQEHALKKGFTRDAIGRIRRYEVPEPPANYDKLSDLVKGMRQMAEQVELEGFQDLVFDAFKKSSPSSETSRKLLLEHFMDDEIAAAYEVMRYSSKVNSIRREAMNHGIQACQSYNSMVLERTQGYRKIGELVEDGFEWGEFWDGTQWVEARVIPRGPQPLVRLTLMDGNVIECSPNHKYLCRDTAGGEQWVEAKDLQPGNQTHRVVLTEPEAAEWHRAVQLPQATHTPGSTANRACLTQLGGDLTALGEFLGRLASNGSVSGAQVTLTVAEHEREVMGKLRRTMQQLGNGHVTERSTQKLPRSVPVHTLTLSSAELQRSLELCGVKSRIPSFVWQDSELLRGYLRGLFDGGGSVHASGAVLTFGPGQLQQRWAREIQQALLLLGIRSRVRHDTKVTGNDNGRSVVQVLKRDMPRFCALVGFLNPVKQAKAEIISGSTPANPTDAEVRGRTVMVRAVEITGEQVEMFDVADSDTRRYMCNGVVTHNTSASITKLALVNLQRYLQDTGYGFITLTIHDSIFFELKREYMRYAVPRIIEIMEEAGKSVLGEGASTPVDGDVGWMEKRPCSCCGEKEYFFNRYLDDNLDVHETKWDEVLCEECVKIGPEGRHALLLERAQTPQAQTPQAPPA